VVSCPSAARLWGRQQQEATKVIDRIKGLRGQEQTCTAGQAQRLILQGAVRHALCELIEEEVAALCGARCAPGAQRALPCGQRAIERVYAGPQGADGAAAGTTPDEVAFSEISEK